MKLLINTIAELFSAILGFFFEGIESLFDGKNNTDASFGNPSDYISSSNTGFVIDGKRSLDMDTSRRNLCVVAGSGMGKTQIHVFPTLLKMASSCSAVVNDNSGELATTISYLESKGVNTHVFNLTKKTGVYINPLDGCKGDPSSVRKLAKSLMANASKEADFFSLSGEDCLALFIEHVVESESIIHANLGNVYRLILEYQGSPETIERYMAETANEKTWTKFKALAGNSQKTLKSITATALSALSWLGENPILTDLTSVSNIKYKDFRSAPNCLFIQSPPSDAVFYAPMVSLILNSFYRFAFAELPSKNDLDIFMILDEFSTLISGLPDYSNIISNSRKFRIPQCLILQSESLLSPYKELKENILDNCYTSVFYGGQDKKAFELEKLLGTYTVEDKETKQKKQVPLMSAHQIREMDGEVLVMTSGKKSIKLKVTPAYKQRKFRRRLAMELPEQSQESVVDYSIQYINLEPYRTNNNQ
jgi:type IV secretory pathway TraG/TraD family ATPase VirD4